MDNKTYTFEFTGKPVDILEDDKTVIEPTIKLICGKLKNCSTIYYWLIDNEFDFEIGDYAIVENMNDYDLVKIIGLVKTKEKYSEFITNQKQNKKVVNIIRRKDVRED